MKTIIIAHELEYIIRYLKNPDGIAEHEDIAGIVASYEYFSGKPEEAREEKKNLKRAAAMGQIFIEENNVYPSRPVDPSSLFGRE